MKENIKKNNEFYAIPIAAKARREEGMNFGDFMIFSSYMLSIEQLKKFRAECISAGMYTDDTMKRYIKAKSLYDNYLTRALAMIPIKRFDSFIKDKLDDALAMNELNLNVSLFNEMGFNETPKNIQAFASRYKQALNYAMISVSVLNRGKEFGVQPTYFSNELMDSIIDIALADCFDGVPKEAWVLVTADGKVELKDEASANALVIMVKLMHQLWCDLCSDIKGNNYEYKA